MGMPALKYEEAPQPVSRPSRANSPRSRARCDANTRARRVFSVFAAVLVVVSLLGIGRVWLSVKAAEASLRSSDLRAAIKTARYEGDMLEIRRSALASPSRVRAIACATMDMEPAGEVTYLDLGETPKPVAKTTAPRDPGAEESALGRMVEDALDLAAGEAQVLLVGDVGLVTAR